MMTKFNTDIHTIVHLGSGEGSNLQKLMEEKPDRVVLVEADPDRYTKLEKTATTYNNVEIHCAAVGGKAEKARLNVYSLAEVSSIRAPKGLLDVFPGLQLREAVEVEVYPASQLVSQLNLDVLRNNWLIVDTPGVEFQVLQDLYRAEQLLQFKYLSLTCGRVSLYEGGTSGFKIVNWLQDRGFDVVKFDEGHDFDIPCWILRRNDLVLSYNKLVRKFKELEKQSALERVELEQQKAKAKELTELSETKAAQLNDLIQENNRIKTVVEEHEQTIDRQSKEVGELQNQLEITRNQIDVLTQRRTEQDIKIDEFVKSQEKQESEISVVQQENARVTQDLAKAVNQLEVLQHKIDQLHSEKEKLQEENSKNIKQIEILKEEKDNIKKQTETEKEKALATSHQLQEEQDYRQQLIDQEVLKAEAQLELMKDILIRDKAF